jgi:hypothetical protein
MDDQLHRAIPAELTAIHSLVDPLHRFCCICSEQPSWIRPRCQDVDEVLCSTAGLYRGERDKRLVLAVARKKGSLTAEEFGRQLASNAEYQARLAAQAARAREIEKRVQPVLDDLRELGFVASSLAEFVRAYAPLPTEASAALLKHLRAADDDSLREPIVRALGGAGEGFDPTALRDLFEATTSEGLRWAIANTMAELRPLLLRDWLGRALMTVRYGKAREMLAVAVGRTLPAAEACHLLMEVYDQLPGHVAMALAECGGAAEAAFLRTRQPASAGWVKKEIDGAIKMIEKRIR